MCSWPCLLRSLVHPVCVESHRRYRYFLYLLLLMAANMYKHMGKVMIKILQGSAVTLTLYVIWCLLKMRSRLPVSRFWWKNSTMSCSEMLETVLRTAAGNYVCVVTVVVVSHICIDRKWEFHATCFSSSYFHYHAFHKYHIEIKFSTFYWDTAW